jgi:membrane fusion protein (multidrug efflux system)
MEENKSTNKKTVIKKIGIFAAAVIFLLAGWFLHGLMIPSSQQGGMPAGMASQSTGPAQIEVGKVQEHPLKPPKEYVGGVEAIERVNLKAQVDGYIDKVHFEEGSIVEKGDLLFTIERDRYKANVKLREANLDKAKANLAEAEKYLKRLRNADDRSIAQSDIDTAQRNMLSAKASVKQAESELELAKINLGYTQIRAPITGKIGKALFTEGNYISPSSGTLAKVVRLDPIRVVFSMTDRQYIKFAKENLNTENSVFQTELRLPDGSIYSDFGEWDFVDNEIDPETATIAVRKLFENKNRQLLPGGYVTVLMTRKDTEQVPMVPQEAVLTDQEGRYVFVVDDEQVVTQRRVKLGAQSGGYNVVEFGLSAGDTVVTGGVQKVTPGEKVEITGYKQQGSSE